ncbi:MAG: AzlC family ABC transporter permease [Alphaproteobacteria bacterium]|jgi:predicted branched-subunit amino acid permease|nr:AzlC family ABC transporter permease [Alphaproteobacteria bacterium]
MGKRASRALTRPLPPVYAGSAVFPALPFFQERALSHSSETILPRSKLYPPRLQGVIEAARLPAFALGATMVGYGAIAREAGLDGWMTVAATIAVFGMPGQVAMITAVSVGAPFLVIFMAVAMANMRMLLIVITGSEMLKMHQQKIPFWLQLALFHIMAISTWVQMGYVRDRYSAPELLNFVLGFALTIAVFAVAGSALGYFAADVIPPDILRVMIFVTPVYLLLLLINARQPGNRLAVVAGGLFCPLLYPLFGSWAILLAGLAGGSVGLLLVKLWPGRKQNG